VAGRPFRCVEDHDQPGARERAEVRPYALGGLANQPARRIAQGSTNGHLHGNTGSGPNGAGQRITEPRGPEQVPRISVRAVQPLHAQVLSRARIGKRALPE
jgi:hypothetical protein